jgi:hypothetical protein
MTLANWAGVGVAPDTVLMWNEVLTSGTSYVCQTPVAGCGTSATRVSPPPIRIRIDPGSQSATLVRTFQRSSPLM